MASTYSTNLAIELIGTGEQSGTWGTTTNTNLGTLLEQAISGYVTQAITDGADTTITIPNGATGVARNMAIEMTGALSATRNLIVPANKKMYFVYNNTSGGFAVTVKVQVRPASLSPTARKYPHLTVQTLLKRTPDSPMTDQDKSQAQAMLNAAIAQRNQAMDQAIQLAAALQLANDKIAELEKPKDVPE
jgi:hypothetical protein